MNLTEREESLLYYIREQTAERGFQPTQRELASYFNCDLKTIVLILRGLEKKGIIKRTRKSRQIIILDDFSAKETSDFSRTIVLPQESKARLFIPRNHKERIQVALKFIFYDYIERFCLYEKEIPIPVPVEEIATKLFGYTIERRHLGRDVAGKLFVKEKLIVVNKTDSLGRQRFTIAHELGHVRLHATQILRPDTSKCEICRKASIESLKEMEANYFAVNLLLPLSRFSAYANDLIQEIGHTPGDQEKGKELTFKLSRIFKVSLETVRIRLQRLGIIKK